MTQESLQPPSCCSPSAADIKKELTPHNQSSPKKPFMGALAVTGIVAVCCFTPLLVIALGVLGLGAVTLYLDYILFPLLAVVVAATIFFYVRWQKSKS